MSPSARYVLDTNVLLHDPGALQAFAGEQIIVPISVIEEIDRFKTEMSAVGRNARFVSTELDRARQRGELARGLPRAAGGLLRVYVPKHAVALPGMLAPHRSGNHVLACALTLRGEEKGRVILVSQDTNIRVKANALGLEAMAYEGETSALQELYTGHVSREVSARELARLRGLENPRFRGSFSPQQGLILNNRHSNPLILRHRGKQRGFVEVQLPSDGVWGLSPRNPEQSLALDLLLDPSLHLVTLTGRAGTGKTLLALAAGLQQLLEGEGYQRMLVSRPIFPMGKDIGYLPGTAQEKLEPWMQPIFDNLELLIRRPVSRAHPAKGYEALLEQGLVTIEPLTYIRGRSIPNQFMIVDEAQNLTPHEIKTIITRVGAGTKIVLTGDAEQIDNPYVDAISNGLSHVVERFREEPLAGHVTLMRGERSVLAELAAITL